MRLLYLGWEICQTPSGKFEARVVCPATSRVGRKRQTSSGITHLPDEEALRQKILASQRALRGPAADIGTIRN